MSININTKTERMNTGANTKLIHANISTKILMQRMAHALHCT